MGCFTSTARRQMHYLIDAVVVGENVGDRIGDQFNKPDHRSSEVVSPVEIQHASQHRRQRSKKPLLGDGRQDRTERLRIQVIVSPQPRYLHDGNQEVASHDNCLVSSIEPKQSFFLVVTWGLEYRMSKLSDEKCRYAEEDREREVEEDKEITKYERAGAQQVKELVYQITMRGVMVVLFALHDFGVETGERFRNLHNTFRHFPD